MAKVENKWLLENLIELTVANFYAFDKKLYESFIIEELRTFEEGKNKE